MLNIDRLQGGHLMNLSELSFAWVSNEWTCRLLFNGQVAQVSRAHYVSHIARYSRGIVGEWNNEQYLNITALSNIVFNGGELRWKMGFANYTAPN